MNLSNVFLVQLPNFSLSFSLLFQWFQLLPVKSYISGSTFVVSLYINSCILTSFPLPFAQHFCLRVLLLFLLTYSMVQSPSWEANWFAASQDIPCISRNLKVHYRTHKRPPPVSILGQPNPVHIPTSHLLEIHPNIIHPSTPRSPQFQVRIFIAVCMLRDVSPRNPLPPVLYPDQASRMWVFRNNFFTGRGY